VCDRVTVSIGISSLIPDLKQGVELLLNQADAALYQTKSKTRNAFSVYQTDSIPEIKNDESI
jgi:PleD family two-component response regulator